jgi:hypothetical protein
MNKNEIEEAAMRWLADKYGGAVQPDKCFEAGAEWALNTVKESGIVVYSYRPDLTWFTNQTTNKECGYCGGTEIECCRFYRVDPIDTHRALLVNIEPIEQCDSV